MGDAAVVFSSFGYLLVIALLLNYSGLTLPIPEYPGGDPPSIDNTGTMVEKKNIFAVAADCSVNVIATPIELLIDFTSSIGSSSGGQLPYPNPFDATAAACSTTQQSKLGDVITNVINGITVSVTFLYQLITFNIPNVPPFLNLVILLPPGVTLVYIGFKLLRGVGG